MRAGKILLCTVLLQCPRGLLRAMRETRLLMRPELTRPRVHKEGWRIQSQLSARTKSSKTPARVESDAFVIFAEKPEHKKLLPTWNLEGPGCMCWCLHVLGIRDGLWHLSGSPGPWQRARLLPRRCRERAVWHWACPALADSGARRCSV